MLRPSTRHRGAGSGNLPLRMSDLPEMTPDAELVLESLTERPTLNTPALIAQHEGIEREQAETALAELVDLGLVKQSPLGWKLKRR